MCKRINLVDIEKVVSTVQIEGVLKNSSVNIGETITVPSRRQFATIVHNNSEKAYNEELQKTVVWLVGTKFRCLILLSCARRKKCYNIFNVILFSGLFIKNISI